MPARTMSLAANVREVWRYRELLRSLAVRNLRVKYQRSRLGFLWTLLNPALSVIVLSAVFSYVVRVDIRHYPAFLVSGYFVWNSFMLTLSSASYVLAEHAPLARAVAFPKEIPILAATISRLVEFAIEIILVVLGLVLFHHHGLPSSFLLLPWLIVVQTLLSLGFAFPLAALSAFYHDVQHLLPITLTLLFYASPVFYPAELVPDSIRQLYMLNPMARVLTAYHQALYAGQWPTPAALLAVSGVSALLAVVGYAIFNRLKATFAEIL